jgi:ATP-dependent Clp protease ATP-binding subunit ClpA
MGARPMARVINNSIKKPLSKLLLAGPLSKGGTVVVDAKGDGLTLKAKKPAPLLLTKEP